MASTTETKGEPTEAPTVSPAPRAGPGSIIPGPSVEGRGGKAFVIFCAQATQNFLTNNSMQMAAAIAFYSFFSLFPLAFLTLLAFDLFDRRAVAHALAAGVEEVARERHCTAIHSNLLRPRDTAPVGGGLVDVLCTRGHRIETLGMCKPLPP